MTWHDQDIKAPNKALLQSITNKESDILQAVSIMEGNVV